MDETELHPMGIPWIGWSDYGDGWGFEAVRSTYASFKNCGNGCLYDVFDDPEERHNKATSQPEVLARMAARLEALNQGVFLPDRGSRDKRSCDRWNGFYGPWIDVPTEAVEEARDKEAVQVLV